jgi:hypothetical protein
MSMPDAGQPERLVAAMIADAVSFVDPDLGKFITGLLGNKKFLAAKPSGPFLPIDRIQEVLCEIQYLVRYPDFNRSIPQRKILAGLLVATLLRRPQWNHTAGINELYLNNLKDPNISMYIIRIREHLLKCLKRPRPTVVRIQIRAAKDTRRGYEVRFLHPEDPEVLEEVLGIRPTQAKIATYNRQGCNGRIVLGVANGMTVHVWTRTAARVLDDGMYWMIMERATRKGALSITLLNPAGALDGGERNTIEKNYQYLQDKISGLQNPLVSARLLLHQGMAPDLDIAQIGSDHLLVGSGDTFEEISASRPLFAAFLALLPRFAMTNPQPELCAPEKDLADS